MSKTVFYHDLLRSNGEETRLHLESFSYPEKSDAKAWRWSLGKNSKITFEPTICGIEFSVSLRYSGTKQTGKIYLDDFLFKEFTLSEEFSQFSEKIEIAPKQKPSTIRFEVDTGPLQAAGSKEERNLGLCFVDLKFLSLPLARAKICPMPFTRMELGLGNDFVPCCSPWLTPNYYELESGTSRWNGPQAQALRESVLNGDYRYCRRDLCQTSYIDYSNLEQLSDPANIGEYFLDKENLAAIQQGQVLLPEGPTAATMMADPRCNLACPSCRPEKILTLDAQAQANVDRASLELAMIQSNLHRIRLAGDGEVLFSPFLRELLKSFNSVDYPKLKIVELHTNGILLSQEVFRELEPGSNLANRLLVSIDAGTEEVYRKVRGGDWNRLQKNLQWAAEQRKTGRFEHFSLLFVYRKENYQTMPAFVALGEEMGADAIYFSPFLSWNRMGIKNYADEAIHEIEHPEYADFQRISKQIQAMNHPRVHFS